jgi:hypothetical protein
MNTQLATGAAMNKVRRLGALVTAMLAVLTVTSLVASPASAARRVKGPEPVNQLIAVQDGQSSWVRVWWKTDSTICDAKLIIWGNSRVDVGYPFTTRNYTSFSNGDMLTRRETDFTAFRVTPHIGRSSWILLAGTMTYNSCGWHARTQSKSTGFLLTVRA